MKQRLIIISDLWGKEKSDWLINYTQVLETKFNITFYDSCELGRIYTSNYSQDSLHKQFVNGGIERAVEKLLELEKEKVIILAFSIGGTIAWNFGIKSNNIISLFCVSSTRLRKETKKPNGDIELFFGENDEFKPSHRWLDRLKIKYSLLAGKNHLIYSEPEFAKQLSKKIIKQHQNKQMDKNPFKELKTERLVLRKIDKSDAEVILFLRSDKAINKFIERPENRKTKTLSDAIKHIEKLNTLAENNQSVSWGITLSPNPEIIGTICLWNFSEDYKTAEVGYDLNPQFQGKGIMTEALKCVLNYGFSNLGFNKIEAYTHNQNKSSIKLLENNGFKLAKNRTDNDNLANAIFVITHE